MEFAGGKFSIYPCAAHSRPAAQPADRSYRVKELVQIAQQLPPLDSLWLTGDLRPVTGRRLKKGGFVQPIYKVGKRTSAEQLIDDILQRYKNGAVLFAYGNVKGFGQELTDYISGNGGTG